MGKTRIKGRRSGEEVDDDFQNNAFDDSPFHILLEKLDSPRESIRYNAILKISGYLSKQSKVSLLNMLKTDLVKKLFQRFLDSCLEIRLVSCGIIKNLTISGGEEVCEYFIQSNIMNLLVSSFSTTHKETLRLWGKTSEDDRNYFQMNLQILNEVIHLMSYLCENSEVATNNITSVHNFIPSILSLLSKIAPTPNTMNLLTGILELVNVVSDENDVFSKNFLGVSKSFDFFLNLMKNMNNGYTPHLRTIIASCLYNIQTERRKDVIKTIIDVIFRSLNFQAVNELKRISPQLLQVETEEQTRNQMGEVDNSKFTLRSMIIRSQYADSIKAQKLSLELLTNIILSLPPNELPGFVMQKKVIETIINLFNHLSQKLPSENVAHITKEMIFIHQTLLRVLGCMNNLVIQCDVDYLNKFNFGNIWNILPVVCKMLFVKYSNHHISFQAECLESILSLLSVIIRKPNIQIKMENSFRDQIEFFRKLTDYPHSVAVRGSAIGMVSQFAVRTGPGPQEMNNFANLFLNKCRDGSIWVVMDALNAIFDVFGDDKYNSILQSVGMLDKLMIIMKSFQERFNRPNNFDEETQMEVNEAMENLNNFIVYKKTKM